MIFGNAEYTFDASEVADADLDVRPVEEARPRVDLAALEENAFDRIKWLKRCPSRRPNLMQMINDRAIELSEQCIGPTAIPGHRLSGPACDFSEIAVGRFDRGDATRGCQVQTISEVKDGAENEGFIELAAFLLLVRKFQPPERIGLPEINPRSEPIPFVLARGKLGRPI